MDADLDLLLHRNRVVQSDWVEVEIWRVENGKYIGASAPPGEGEDPFYRVF
jgi:hypothetical protein